MSDTQLTPAEETYAAARQVRASFGKVEAAMGSVAVDVAKGIADWLDTVADEMSDDHAYVVEHPEWIGLAENMRWGVHASYGAVTSDNGAWKDALITARAINGGAR